MRAYHGAGQRATAFRLYREVRGRLVEELGVEPAEVRPRTEPGEQTVSRSLRPPRSAGSAAWKPTTSSPAAASPRSR
ncbi:BTAD domain-containing putative transcriptional regulator [Amycolatopsis sp. NPDC089917]|uniref:BTAD domain-containing putative transcriptional regulator n=1 Tax=Amycolatopsis sp. NPDC089917 TaxID=3155187 RepID=UPI00341924C8